ncbi:unnamed protein product [Medioppia subpectinata]|uniref:Uncharacterized protein n=1 Tax=Medioppia subpectinata TaxID=1979941 RepID=A0A7R9KQ86_9ACAR|nr:unnamed protein product [Medioppia subpectinata]CAG2106411.1 unnamed protein product [Medioppia subpectinata]
MAKTKTNQKLLKFSRQSASGQQQANSKDSASRADNPQTKQKLMTTNTSLPHVLAMISMGKCLRVLSTAWDELVRYNCIIFSHSRGVCRRITNNDLIRQRLIVYLCLVLIGGLLNDFAPLISRSFMFKVAKNNVLNQWFVKIGWFWTLVLTSPLIAITSAVLADDRLKSEANGRLTRRPLSARTDTKFDRLKQLVPYLRTRQMFRLVFNTVVWYLSTNFFLYFEDMTGSCLTSQSVVGINYDKINCVKSGYKWIPGFDISGHTFLLIFSNLILIEESAVMIGWEPFGHQLFTQNTNNDNSELIPNPEQYRLYNKHSKIVRLLFILITVLSLIWDFMLLQTSLFYHTMLQKLVAAVWATTAWLLTYRYGYKRFAIDVKPPKLNRNS